MCYGFGHCYTAFTSGPMDIVMLVKIAVIAVLVVIVFSLFGALRSLVRNQEGDKQRTVKMLAYRVGFSALLLVMLGVAFALGWIQPHGLKG
ncbi:twin transmembrane helix small protein [Ketobacter sp.]|uniref:twin transmembrane helix small protein n=1 Tax=Ketobacter sp. TaxID=2083498 RepID=UPI003983A292